MYKINEKVLFEITDTRPDFDLACGFAYDYFISAFDIDDSGNINNVEGALRSSSSLDVEFVTLKILGGMCGVSYNYVFSGKITQCEDAD